MLFFDLFRHVPPMAEFSAGQAICRGGEHDHVMYVLRSGRAGVTAGGLRLEKVDAGDSVGELGVLDGIPRIATVTALTPCTTAVVDQQRFNFLAESSPGFALEVMQVMARRLREQSPGA